MSWDLNKPIIVGYWGNQYRKFVFQNSNQELIYNNSDATKYAKFSNLTITAYNSAIYDDGEYYWFFILTDNSGHIDMYGSSTIDGSYSYNIGFHTELYTGSTLYCASSNNYTIENLKCEWKVKKSEFEIIESVLSIFTSLSEFTTYVENLYEPYNIVIANGGGATHIAKVTGLLSTLSSNLSDILIVSGGGGGGFIANNTAYDGADAGGVSGSGELSGNQSTGYRFGQGESSSLLSGGGSGLYGGYKSNLSSGAGAGSGYIGNELLINKKMVGHNVPTSDNEDDLTESVNTYSENHDESLPQSGNGYARISYVGDFCPGSQWIFKETAGWAATFIDCCGHIYNDAYWEDVRKICDDSSNYPYFTALKDEVIVTFTKSFLNYASDYPLYRKQLWAGLGVRFDRQTHTLFFYKDIDNGLEKTYEVEMQYDDNGNLVTSYAIFGGINHTTQKGLIFILEYNSLNEEYRFLDDVCPTPNEQDYISLTSGLIPELPD